MRTKAIILAGGKGTRLSVLTIKRAKPAVPFGGKYRIIDFPLSNCVNSNIFDVLVLTQYRPHSLNEHIGKGRPWDLDRSFTGGVILLQPYQGSFDTDWYAGTADAVAQNLNFIRHGNPEYVLILSGDHIYNMDYSKLVNYHREKQADVTVCTRPVPIEDASRFGIIDIDDNYRIVDFVEKPANPPGNLANMGIYLFNYDVLKQAIEMDKNKPGSSRDFGKDIIPALVEQEKNLVAYSFDNYWVDVGTLPAYWQAHMDLLSNDPELDMNDRNWIVHTRSEERPPVRIADGSTIKDSLITDGSEIAPDAIIERSVLSPGVKVGAGAVVRESIILNDAHIHEGAVVERAIIDKVSSIGENSIVGGIMDELKITCVGKNAVIPADYVVKPGAVIGTDASTEDFEKFADLIIPEDTLLAFASRK